MNGGCSYGDNNVNSKEEATLMLCLITNINVEISLSQVILSLCGGFLGFFLSVFVLCEFCRIFSSPVF